MVCTAHQSLSQKRFLPAGRGPFRLFCGLGLGLGERMKRMAGKTVAAIKALDKLDRQY